MNSLLHFFAVTCITAVVLTGATFLDSSSPVAVEIPPTIEFSSHIRFKVVQYFDTFEEGRLGLNTGRGETEMSLGKVLSESQRQSLTDVPKELARVLPVCPQQVGYHIAGNYLIAVDSHYGILDSILIPTLHRTSPRDHEMAQWVSHQTASNR